MTIKHESVVDTSRPHLMHLSRAIRDVESLLKATETNLVTETLFAKVRMFLTEQSVRQIALTRAIHHHCGHPLCLEATSMYVASLSSTDPLPDVDHTGSTPTPVRHHTNSSLPAPQRAWFCSNECFLAYRSIHAAAVMDPTWIPMVFGEANVARSLCAMYDRSGDVADDVHTQTQTQNLPTTKKGNSRFVKIRSTLPNPGNCAPVVKQQLPEIPLSSVQREKQASHPQELAPPLLDPYDPKLHGTVLGMTPDHMRDWGDPCGGEDISSDESTPACPPLNENKRGEELSSSMLPLIHSMLTLWTTDITRRYLMDGDIDVIESIPMEVGRAREPHTQFLSGNLCQAMTGSGSDVVPEHDQPIVLFEIDNIVQTLNTTICFDYMYQEILKNAREQRFVWSLIGLGMLNAAPRLHGTCIDLNGYIQRLSGGSVDEATLRQWVQLISSAFTTL